jgi:hypothetical protein
VAAKSTWAPTKERPSITHNTMAVWHAGAMLVSEDVVLGTAGGAVVELMIEP